MVTSLIGSYCSSCCLWFFFPILPSSLSDLLLSLISLSLSLALSGRPLLSSPQSGNSVELVADGLVDVDGLIDSTLLFEWPFVCPFWRMD